MTAIQLRVSPTDTLRVVAGSVLSYDCSVLADGNKLSSAYVNTDNPFTGKNDLIGPSDNTGLLKYSITVPDNGRDTLVTFRFIGSSYGSRQTQPVFRAVRVVEGALAVTISCNGVAPDGSLLAEPIVPTQSLHTRSSLPFLPYVLFDDGSAAINSRYVRLGPSIWTDHSLDGKDAFDANHAALDIIGSRLHSAPSAHLTIVGTNSNSGQEKNNITLSKARAVSVAEYFTSIWQIDSNRLTIDQRNLPELPTNPATQPGIQENRRVEMTSDDANITAPIKLENRQVLAVGDATLAFDIGLSPDSAHHTYSSWLITMDKDGAPVGNPISGIGAPPALVYTSVKMPQEYLNQAIHYNIAVRDAYGYRVSSDGYVRIIPQTVETESLEKYAMIMFDFDQANVNSRAMQELQLVAQSVSEDAVDLKIDGYCDATGTPEYNQTLSEARASSAGDALHAISKLPAKVVVTGHGLRDPKFSNDLPEGRQLNRRVEFRIGKKTR